MVHIILKAVLSEFDGDLATVEKYEICAQKWVAFRHPPGIPQFATKHRDTFIEMAFLRAFQAWENFLEEAFTLYLLGKKPPNGKRLYGQVPVRTRNQARHVLLHGQSYVEWSPCYKIIGRNRDIFKNFMNTYFQSLDGISSSLDEISDLRNAIAHRSESSWEKYKKIVRNNLRGSYPPNLSVGGFLMTTVPGSSPPETFLDVYLERLRYGASLVVPV